MSASYVIIFSLESLKQEDGQPNPGACTIYNMIVVSSQLMGKAIVEGKLSDPIPFVDLITDQPETERAKIMEWLKFCDIELPRALRLGNDPIGTDTVLAVFDDDQKRVDMWRGIGATCFQLSEAPRIKLLS